MAAGIKWAGTSGTTNIDHGQVPPITLSDGTVVFIDVDSASSPYTCYLRYCSPAGSGNPTTPNAIATLTTNSPAVGLCRDGSNNIYVTYLSITTADLYGQAFKWTGTLGSSYSWTTETAVNSGTSDYWPSGGQIATWVNDGGGTSGAGHILTMLQAGSGDKTAVFYTLDAGVLLAGTGTLYAGSGATATTGSAVIWHYLSNNGFGATSGLWCGAGLLRVPLVRFLCRCHHGGLGDLPCQPRRDGNPARHAGQRRLWVMGVHLPVINDDGRLYGHGLHGHGCRLAC
jgi:hypothetical protein